jgi:rubredoxin
MEKWKCKICGYIYDPGKGDPDANVSPTLLFKSFQMTGPVLCAALPQRYV